MPRIFRLAIDEETLTDELFAFVCDPRSTRYQRRVVGELRALAPGMIPVMEMMILDGVEERHHVREYIAAVIGDGADRDVFYVTWQRRGRIASAFATKGGECSWVNARTSPSPSVLRRLEGEGYRHGE